MSKPDAKDQFDTYYKMYFKYVYHYVYRRAGTKEDTEDIVSETFVAAWKSWGSLTENANVKSWLFAIAQHKLTDWLRRKYKFTANFAEVPVEILSEYKEAEPSKATINSDVPILHELVSKLSTREQKFVRLRFEQNYKLAEVAEALDLTLTNAKIIQHRLIKKLRNDWEQYK